MNQNIFWLNKPEILLNNAYIFDIVPSNTNDIYENLNAITRFVIIVTIISYILTNNEKLITYFIMSIICILLIYFYYKNKDNRSREGFSSKNEFINSLKNMTSVVTESNPEFTSPTKNNPMMNVLMTDYVDNPQKPEALPSFNKTVEKVVNEKVKENLDKRLFQNLGDEIQFEHFMRNFNTMPWSTIPNDQTAFAQFCYGGMKSCKEVDNDGLTCMKNNERYILR